jgi:glycogen debranching enzyme
MVGIEELAARSLEACITEIGYAAGKHHFVDLWARDSLFACLGNLDSDGTRVTIETFFQYQRKDGLIPYRIRRSSLSIKKYFGMPEMLVVPKADFRSFQSGGIVLDGGIMLLFVIGEYLKATNDISFVKKFTVQIEKAVAYYFNRFGNELLSEWFLCEWADAVMKSGKVLYTNVLYIIALRSVSMIHDRLGVKNEQFERAISSVEQKFQREFWTGKYYCDWIDYRQQNYLAAFPNLLAVCFDIASEEQSKSIFNEVQNRCVTDLGVKSNYPRYPFWRIPVQNYLAGVPDYHNGIFWLQSWVFYVVVAHKLGHNSIRDEQLAKLSAAVTKHEFVYENYERDWSFVNRKFYKSEGPFAWSSGIVLYMLKIVHG